MKVTVPSIVAGALRTVPKSLAKTLWEQDNENHGIVKIGQNTQNSPGDQGRLVVSQTSVEKPSAKRHYENYIPEMTLTDYIYLEKREGEDSPASGTALTHQYNGPKTT